MPKIYDGFLFNNEFDILELRLQEHWNYVDKFILVESLRTHRDQPKPLWFAENKERFKPYLNKIQHIIVPTVTKNIPYEWGNPQTGSPEDQARNHIPWGLYDADPNDVLLVSDVDELWRPSALEFIKNDTTHSTFSPLQILSHFKINFVCATINDPNRCNGYMAWSKGIRFRDFKAHWKLDSTALKANGILSCLTEDRSYLQNFQTAVIPHGGWHFSWWGQPAQILDKLSSYGHREHETQYIKRLIETQTLIPSKLQGIHIPSIGNIFPEHEWILCTVDNYFPETITKNIEKFQDLILPNAQESITKYLPTWQSQFDLVSQLQKNISLHTSKS